MAALTRPLLLAALGPTFLACLLVQVARAAGIPEKAVNLTWNSTNFKTILKWEPKPVNYFYTVQIRSGSQDWKDKCNLTTDTECDVTEEIIQDVYQTYEARVLSVPQSKTKWKEVLFSNATKFTPYQETQLGQPVIHRFTQDGTKLNVMLEDSSTLVRKDKNGTFLTLRGVFGKDLSYILTYWNNLNTERKTAETKTNEFLIDVDKGAGYCFTVQAQILSRKKDQRRPESTQECTDQWTSILGGIPEKAVNLTWNSTNFKTILKWEPKPVDYFYTVQIRSGSQDWKDKCNLTTDTECDVTEEIIQDVYQTYEARVLSVPQSKTKWKEVLFSNATKFTPYQETQLGQPVIHRFTQDGTKLNVMLEDSSTLVRKDKNGTFLTLRGVFGKDLSYILTYWNNLNTERKTAETKTNEFLIDVDKGAGYCFTVQAQILSRKKDQRRPESTQECTDQWTSILGGISGKAFNLNWKSTNFKTILKWEPNPINYVYTVQIRSGSQDWKDKCNLTTDTECDVTDEIIQDVHQTYEARVLSVPQNKTKWKEVLFSNATKFTPYQETQLEKPFIKMFEQDGTKLNVTVENSRTLFGKNDTFLTPREVFGENLNYILFYQKSSSKDVKKAETKTNEFSIDVEEGAGYCFSVRAQILSRKTNQMSPKSIGECTDQWKSVLEETIIIVGALVLVVSMFAIFLSISLCQRRKGRAGQNR